MIVGLIGRHGRGAGAGAEGGNRDDRTEGKETCPQGREELGVAAFRRRRCE